MGRAIMNGSGRLTVPADARKQLGLEGETDFEVEVDRESDTIILRPATLVAREDAWAYTAEHRSELALARADAREGRVYRLTEPQLRKLAEEAERARQLRDA